jgi:hypothetical protein
LAHLFLALMLRCFLIFGWFDRSHFWTSASPRPVARRKAFDDEAFDDEAFAT